ncbi:MAG: ATPase [Latescibacteria bacterium DG_63]|nr:MAG: ATPase [Latescibacteria bacterium DG_63]
MIVGDFGTSYTKLWKVGSSESPRVMRSTELGPDVRADYGTGHNAHLRSDRVVNELVALATGARELVEAPDFLVVDCGSRDVKFIAFENGRFERAGWNSECGSSMGFSIELLEMHFKLDYQSLQAQDEHLPVACGILGMSAVFDAVARGEMVEAAVAKFVKGIAVNAHRFAGCPSKMYLCGGLCENPLFVRSVPAEVVPLGRFLLLEGLVEIAGKGKWTTSAEMRIPP